MTFADRSVVEMTSGSVISVGCTAGLNVQDFYGRDDGVHTSLCTVLLCGTLYARPLKRRLSERDVTEGLFGQGEVNIIHGYRNRQLIT